MGWHTIHDAPRDKRVWAFLPAAEWKSRPDGAPFDVKSAVVLVDWFPNHHGHSGAWVSWQTGHAVYPSMWNDADIEAAAPEAPELKASDAA